MSETATTSEPRVKHKTFVYRTHLQWDAGRAGVLGSGDRPALRVSSPPEFRGEAGVWTPEDLFVAAVEICMMTTFAAFAQRLALPVISYSSEAEGVMEMVDGAYRFTRVTLRPRILVGEAAALAQVERALEDAHRSCIISNSIRPSVLVESTIESWSAREDGDRSSTPAAGRRAWARASSGPAGRS